MHEFAMIEPQFIADVMLGRLSRKLRMLGYDTLYFQKIDDDTLVNRAVERRPPDPDPKNSI